MAKQGCKFPAGTLVFESHDTGLLSVYVALGCNKFYRRVCDIQITRECAQGSEFFLPLGTMDKWGNDYDADKIRVSGSIVSLPSNATHQWDAPMTLRYNSAIKVGLAERKGVKWAWRVALYKQWKSNPIFSTINLLPRCKATLSGEVETLIGLFKAYLGH